MKPIRISEVGTMGTCEKMWHYRYVKEVPSESSAAMSKGTLLHAMYAAWWKNPEFTQFDMVDEINPDHLPDVVALAQQDVDDAHWLFARFMAVHGPTRDEWELVESEVEMEAEVDGLLLQGRADAIVRHKATDKLYLAECKSMRDWRRLDILQVDPQVTHYYLLCHASGYPVNGVMYDALKTYRWKRDEHPAQDSVQRLFLDRSAEQCEASLDDLNAFDCRRADLIHGGHLPLRNISSFGSCAGCSYRPQCWEELSFPETKIILEGE